MGAGKELDLADMRWVRAGVCGVLVGFASVLGTWAAPAGENPGVPWPAADALGRALPLADEVGPPKADRFVGIFYFLWVNERHNKSPQGDHPYDISKILAADPDALRKPDSPLWGGIGQPHFWGEPLYGYYNSDDPWVIRRHAQLLADAGVDVLIFDATNAATYRETYLKLCEVFTQVRKEGGRTPQIAFMVNTQAGQTAERIYRELYEPGRYRELWFHWRGKPLMICDPKAASDELRAFFTLRRAHWPFRMENTKDAWHWEATYPQPYGYADDPKTPEQVNVSVAQNLGAFGKHSVQNMSSGKGRGRGFHDGKQDHSPEAVLGGANFAEQWRRAYELEPPFVMVTGWNEWIAGRFARPGEPVAFVDQFDREYSRDIEPMQRGHGDNFYYQMVAGIRRYKGAPPLPKTSVEKTIRIGQGFAQWADVGPEYLDYAGETIPRDQVGAAGLRYTNNSGRNDLAAMKVARDAENVYFYLGARADLRLDKASPGLWLLIDADRDAKTGWQGYDYIVNRSADGGATWLEKNEGNAWSWTKLVKVGVDVKGPELQLAVPRATIGIAFDFKWADNLQRAGDGMDFYLSGDVAPEGRFNYRFAAE
jgi:hypothetical protein